jgi:hypothetical protein
MAAMTALITACIHQERGNWLGTSDSHQKMSAVTAPDADTITHLKPFPPGIHTTR